MRKLKVLFTLLFSKHFLLITGDADKQVVTNYPDNEIVRSHKALYFK